MDDLGATPTFGKHPFFETKPHRNQPGFWQWSPMYICELLLVVSAGFQNPLQNVHSFKWIKQQIRLFLNWKGTATKMLSSISSMGVFTFGLTWHTPLFKLNFEVETAERKCRECGRTYYKGWSHIISRITAFNQQTLNSRNRSHPCLISNLIPLMVDETSKQSM